MPKRAHLWPSVYQKTHACTQRKIIYQFDERKQGWLVQKFGLRWLQTVDVIQTELPFLLLTQEDIGKLCLQASRFRALNVFWFTEVNWPKRLGETPNTTQYWSNYELTSKLLNIHFDSVHKTLNITFCMFPLSKLPDGDDASFTGCQCRPSTCGLVSINLPWFICKQNITGLTIQLSEFYWGISGTYLWWVVYLFVCLVMCSWQQVLYQCRNFIA